MRSNMAPSRFNSLAILHGHKNLTAELNLIHVVNDFYSKLKAERNFLGHLNKTKLPKCFQNSVSLKYKHLPTFCSHK